MPVIKREEGVFRVKDIIVLKCGGSTMKNLTDSFFTNIKTLQKSGLKPIIVHGGGPEIKAMLDQLQIETEFVNGLRKTTSDVMDVVEMVLSGSVNNALVRKLNKAGMKSIGLSGADANLFEAVPKDFENLGYVGQMTRVNIAFLFDLLAQDIVPVIAPIAVGKDGNRYNVNADTVAGEVAKTVLAKQLIFVTDVPGILKDGELLESVTESDIKTYLSTGVIHGGMIPKVEAALYSLNDHLQEAMIVDGNQEVLAAHETVLVGTVIKRSTEVMEHVSNITNV